jgi:hypothetical protein
LKSWIGTLLLDGGSVGGDGVFLVVEFDDVGRDVGGFGGSEDGLGIHDDGVAVLLGVLIDDGGHFATDVLHEIVVGRDSDE